MKPSSSAPKPFKGPKPSVEIVEISSVADEDEAVTGRGALRGLSQKLILPECSTEASVEATNAGDEAEVKPSQPSTRSTRGSRYGRADVNYDMKYHPMDEVTRPLRAAKRRSGGRSVSESLTHEDGVTSDESEPPSPMSGSESDEDDADDDEDEESAALMSTQRAKDPKATRTSTRAAAKKPVDYSRFHHPQDRWLLGRKHRNENLVPTDRDLDSLPTKRSRKHERSEYSDEVTDNDVPGAEGREVSAVYSKPRKKLRSTGSSSPAKSKQHDQSSPATKRIFDDIELPRMDDMNSDELNEQFDSAARGSQMVSRDPAEIDEDMAVAPTTLRSTPSQRDLTQDTIAGVDQLLDAAGPSTGGSDEDPTDLELLDKAMSRATGKDAQERSDMASPSKLPPSGSSRKLSMVANQSGDDGGNDGREDVVGDAVTNRQPQTARIVGIGSAKLARPNLTGYALSTDSSSPARLSCDEERQRQGRPRSAKMNNSDANGIGSSLASVRDDEFTSPAFTASPVFSTTAAQDAEHAAPSEFEEHFSITEVRSGMERAIEVHGTQSNDAHGQTAIGSAISSQSTNAAPVSTQESGVLPPTVAPSSAATSFTAAMGVEVGGLDGSSNAKTVNTAIQAMRAVDSRITDTSLGKVHDDGTFSHESGASHAVPALGQEAMRDSSALRALGGVNHTPGALRQRAAQQLDELKSDLVSEQNVLNGDENRSPQHGANGDNRFATHHVEE